MRQADVLGLGAAPTAPPAATSAAPAVVTAVSLRSEPLPAQAKLILAALLSCQDEL